jgi:hypothetical protein
MKVGGKSSKLILLHFNGPLSHWGTVKEGKFLYNEIGENKGS